MSKVLTFLRRYSLMILIFLLLGGATVYYFIWHWKPFTQNAFLFANTRAVTPLVDGYITEILVKNNQFVKKGDVLFRTFRPPYTLRCVQLRHEIDALQASVKSYDAKIAAADSSIAQRSALLANASYLSERAGMMYQRAAVSQAYTEERFRTMQAESAALENVRFSKKALEHDRDAALAGIRRLEAALELAEIYEKQTEVTALSDGYVTNMSIAPGTYCTSQDVLFGFVDTTQWFLQANFKESELSELQPGVNAKIWIWQFPGRVFHGEVDHSGFSAERRSASKTTGLPVVEKENEWFFLPQRYPVQIRLLDPPDDLTLHTGASAYVELEIYSHPIRQFFWQLFLRSN